MSKFTLTLVTIASLAKVAPAVLAKDAAADFETGRIAYLNGAKRLIALTEKVGAAEASSLLKKAGVAEHTVKNARQLVRVYEALVVAGHVSEEWFNDVLYMDAVAINAALAKVDAKKLAEAGVWKKSVKSASVECQLVAETGMTHAERLAFAERQEKKAKEAAAHVAPAAANAEVTITPSTESAESATPTVATAAPAAATPEATVSAPAVEEVAKPTPAPEAPVKLAEKPPVNPMTEFSRAADDLEALTVAVLAKMADEVTIGTIRERLVALNRAVEEAIKVKVKSGRKSVAA